MSYWRSSIYIFLSTLGLITYLNGSQPKLTADDPIEFNVEKKTIVATGNARIEHDMGLLEADRIEFNREDLQAEASGNVQLTRKNVRLLSEELGYNFETRQVRSEGFKFGKPPVYAKGKHFEGGLDQVEIDNAVLYYGEPDAISPNLLVRNAILMDTDDKPTLDTVVARGITFRIGKIPFFYLPYYKYSMREYPVSIYSTYGASGKYGAFLRNRITLKGYEPFKWGGNVDYYTKRGWLLGPVAQYNIGNGENRIWGELESGYIRDHGQRGKDFLGRDIPKNRHFIEWQHQQDMGERLHAVGQLRMWKDPDSLRDFRPKKFANNQDPDSFGEVVYSGDNYYLSAFTRYYPNDFQFGQERLPELNFDLLTSQILDTPVYHRGNMNFVRLEAKDPTGMSPRMQSNRFDGFYGWNMPLNLGSAATLTPVLGGCVTHYLSSGTNRSDFTRYRGQVGADLEFRGYGQSECRNKFWGIDGLRHLVTPKIKYRYVPMGKSGHGPIPIIESHMPTMNLEPIDLGYLRDRDAAHEIHTLRFGVENLFQTRADGYGSRDLAWLNIYEDLRFTSRPGLRPWSDIYTELGLRPAYWMTFRLYNRFNPETLKLEELRTRLTLIDGKVWKMDIMTDNLAKKTDQYYLNIGYSLTSRARLRGSWRYDARQSRLTEQHYSLVTLLGHSWEVEYRISNYRGTARENEIKYGIFIDLLSHK